MGSSSGSTYAMATVSVAMDKALGTSILVGPNGHTLYLLTVDTPTSSKCTGSCAMIWPPLEVKGMPTVGSGLKASLLGTITRSGGVKQVTYDGHPLYYHDADKAPGQITGEGVGNVWYAVSPSGNPVKGPVTTSSSSTSSSSGYGSGY
jgi:predicted lipoprotein with Yx(FWY)xxD motif